MSDGRRTVLVLNHFAVPREQPGGTRHIELFSRMSSLDFIIVAAKLNLTTGAVQNPSPHFAFVRVPRYSSNGLARILNWAAYAFQAVIIGLLQRPDAVYASSPHMLAGLAGWLIAKIRRVPFVLEVRDLWPQVLSDMGLMAEASTAFRVLRRLELFLYRHADRIVTMAPGTTSEVMRQGIAADKLLFLPNAADPSDFVPSSGRSELRQRFGFSRITGVYAGAHGPANGLELLLDAAKMVEDLDVEIVLVGDGLEKTRLVDSSKLLGLNNVRFLDPVAKTAMPDLLAAADFGIHVLADVPLFRTAVSPNKVYDYMAASRPVLTNCPGVVGDMVADADAGVVVNPSSLADGIRHLVTLKNEDLTSMGRNGMVWLQANHSRTSVAEDLEHLLETLMPKGGLLP